MVDIVRSAPQAVGVTWCGVSGACWLAWQLDQYWDDASIVSSERPEWLVVLLSLYLAGLTLSRYWCHGAYTIYETLWGCNVAMYLALLGVWHGRRFLIGMAACMVAGDQVCWYIDAVAYVWCGQFPIGVMKYLLYKVRRRRL